MEGGRRRQSKWRDKWADNIQAGHHWDGLSHSEKTQWQVLPQGVKVECELVDAGGCGSRIREDVPVRRKTGGDRV